MRRTDVAAAVNAAVRPIVEYGVDPRGAGMFEAIAGVGQRAGAGREGVRVLDPVRRFNGIAVTPQRFIGVAPLGVSRTVTPRAARLDGEPSVPTLDDTALRVFAERLRRGK